MPEKNSTPNFKGVLPKMKSLRRGYLSVPTLGRETQRLVSQKTAFARKFTRQNRFKRMKNHLLFERIKPSPAFKHVYRNIYNRYLNPQHNAYIKSIFGKKMDNGRWSSMDMALTGSGAAPQEAAPQNIPALRPVSSGTMNLSAGMAIPRKEDDPLFQESVRRKAVREAEPKKPQLTPEHRIFRRVEEISSPKGKTGSEDQAGKAPDLPEPPAPARRSLPEAAESAEAVEPVEPVSPEEPGEEKTAPPQATQPAQPAQPAGHTADLPAEQHRTSASAPKAGTVQRQMAAKPAPTPASAAKPAVREAATSQPVREPGSPETVRLTRGGEEAAEPVIPRLASRPAPEQPAEPESLPQPGDPQPEQPPAQKPLIRMDAAPASPVDRQDEKPSQPATEHLEPRAAQPSVPVAAVQTATQAPGLPEGSESEKQPEPRSARIMNIRRHRALTRRSAKPILARVPRRQKARVSPNKSRPVRRIVVTEPAVGMEKSTRPERSAPLAEPRFRADKPAPSERTLEVPAGNPPSLPVNPESPKRMAGLRLSQPFPRLTAPAQPTDQPLPPELPLGLDAASQPPDEFPAQSLPLVPFRSAEAPSSRPEPTVQKTVQPAPRIKPAIKSIRMISRPMVQRSADPTAATARAKPVVFAAAKPTAGPAVRPAAEPAIEPAARSGRTSAKTPAPTASPAPAHRIQPILAGKYSPGRPKPQPSAPETAFPEQTELSSETPILSTEKQTQQLPKLIPVRWSAQKEAGDKSAAFPRVQSAKRSVVPRARKPLTGSQSKLASRETKLGFEGETGKPLPLVKPVSREMGPESRPKGSIFQTEMPAPGRKAEPLAFPALGETPSRHEDCSPWAPASSEPKSATTPAPVHAPVQSAPSGVVQRTLDTTAASPAAATSSAAENNAQPAQKTKVDLNRLADQLYPILVRRLEIERERYPGRHR